MAFDDKSSLFLEEAEDLLKKAETALLELEDGDDPSLVNEVFRALHTIKGSGAMFGFEAVASFTHSVENLFDEVRQGRVSITKDIVELGLRSVDAIAALLADPSMTDEHRAVLRAIDDLSVPPASATPEAGAPRAWRIVLRPQKDLLTRGVQIEPLLAELSEFGPCRVHADLDEVPPLGRLDPIELHVKWELFLSTDRSEAELRQVFLFVADYVDLSIEPLDWVEDHGPPPVPRIGEILVRKGELTPPQVEAIRVKFGELAVAKGLVTPKQIEAALAEQEILRNTSAERATRRESATIRVRKEKLDKLVDLVGELVILQSILELEARQAGQPRFEQLAESLARLVEDLRDTSMSVRMVPMGESVPVFRRLVRDVASQLGKEISLDVTGTETELDKNVVEVLKDPLVHILRNSADHGIEPPGEREAAGKPREGRIRLAARQAGARVEIVVSDDGRGLDEAKIRSRAVERGLLDPAETNRDRVLSMIFEPGFSTAEKTTDLSGRGVGMDVVKRNLEKLRGTVSVQSVARQGTSVTLSIPLTLVIVEGLLVRLAAFDYIIALSQVVECVDLSDDIVISRQGEAITMITLRGTTIPIISLRESLGIEGRSPEPPRLVIVSNEGALFGLMVDSVVGRTQVVIKPLSAAVKQIRILSGATILGDGSVALILDVPEIVKQKADAV